MKELEKSIRGIEKDGLVWGGSKLVPVGYGVRKLQINLVIEDDKISLEELQEEIEGYEDYVQSSGKLTSFTLRAALADAAFACLQISPLCKSFRSIGANAMWLATKVQLMSPKPKNTNVHMIRSRPSACHHPVLLILELRFFQHDVRNKPDHAIEDFTISQSIGNLFPRAHHITALRTARSTIPFRFLNKKGPSQG